MAFEFIDGSEFLGLNYEDFKPATVSILDAAEIIEGMAVTTDLADTILDTNRLPPLSQAAVFYLVSQQDYRLPDAIKYHPEVSVWEVTDEDPDEHGENPSSFSLVDRAYRARVTRRGPGQSHMEFAVVEGWRRLLGEWRYQLGSRVPERRGTRVGAFLCSEQGFFCSEPPTGFFICDCPEKGALPPLLSA